jgi:WD40 repeat protein
MNAPETENRVCGRCGTPLGDHLQEGLCSRCLARFALLEEEPPEPTSEIGSQPSELPKPGAEDSGARQITRFGDYELLEEIAHGGMGVVYKARQLSLNRIVAVKMLLFGQFAGKAAFDRFRSEAETAARLQHPNIVAIHGVGETEGQPYFSMDYVAGRSLAEIVRDHPLPVRQAATYLRTIARAVHYAHTQGVLHRDLKPANVLIDANDEPRITDFGLARQLAGDSALTLTGQVVGSPNFMPPEQGAGKKAKLGPPADVYGLGAMLYYLITARPPFVAETFEATLAQVLNNEPVPPRQLNPGVPRDLETICLKCLEKDPERRYASAQELAEELDRFLKGEPLRARPIGVVGKTWRWCLRKPAMAGMAGSLFFAIVLGLGGVLTQWRRAEQIAVRESALAEVRLQERYAADMAVVQSRMQEGNISMARQVLTDYLPAPGRADLRGFEWFLYYRLSQGEHLREITNALFPGTLTSTKDGSMLALGRFAGAVWLVDPDRSTVEYTFGTAALLVCSVDISPDDHLLAAGSERVSTPPGTEKGIVEIFDLQTLNRLAQLKAALPKVAFSPREKLLAVGTGHDTGEVLLWHYAEPDREPERLPESGGRAIFSPDGKLLVTGLRNMQLMIWDMATRQRIAQAPAGSWLTGMKFSPAGDVFATGNKDGMIRLWDPQTCRLIGIMAGHTKQVTGLEFLDGGRLLASGSADQTVRIWDVRQQKLQTRLQSRGASQAMTVCGPGKTLVTWGSTQSLQFWSADAASNSCVLPATVQAYFSPDGSRMICESTDGTVRLYETETRRVVNTISNLLSPVASTLRRDGPVRSRLLGFAGDRTNFVTADVFPDTVEVVRLRFWNTDSGAVIREVEIQPKKGFLSPLVLSPDGKWLMAGSISGEVALWDAETGRHLQLVGGHSKRIVSLVFSPNSRVLASTSGDFSAALIEVSNWRVLRRFQANTTLTAGAFSPDGKLYAATGYDWQTYLWRVNDGQLIAKLAGHQMTSRAVAFSPDMKTLVTGSDDSTIRFWNLSTGREMGSLPTDGSVLGMSFSPNGQVLACTISGESGRWIRLWDCSGATNDPPTTRLSRLGTPICEWWLAGPYMKPGAATNDLLDVPFEPETRPEDVRWRKIFVPDGVVDFGNYFPGEFRVAYLRTKFVSSANQKVGLLVGSDDGVRAWLNGAVVYQTNISRIYWDDPPRIGVNLREGPNELQLKVVNFANDWKAGVKFATFRGRPLTSIQVLTNEVGPGPVLPSASPQRQLAEDPGAVVNPP